MDKFCVEGRKEGCIWMHHTRLSEQFLSIQMWLNPCLLETEQESIRCWISPTSLKIGHFQMLLIKLFSGQVSFSYKFYDANQLCLICAVFANFKVWMVLEILYWILFLLIHEKRLPSVDKMWVSWFIFLFFQKCLTHWY